MRYSFSYFLLTPDCRSLELRGEPFSSHRAAILGDVVDMKGETSLAIENSKK